MFTISIIGQKGGTGKTTLALGLAVAAERAGYSVAVIDLDPQASASNWKDRRGKETPPAVVSAQTSRLMQTLAIAEESGAHFAIIDTAGRSDDSALRATRTANLVLVPTRATLIELEALPAARDIIRLAGEPPAFVVLNGAHPQATTSITETRAMIEQTSGLPVCPAAHLSHRAAYADALTTGRTAQELDPEGHAAGELERLFRFVSEIVKKRTPETMTS